LQDVHNSTKKSPPIKSIVVLGDNESGRSSLIARLKGAESVSKGLGFEYHYIDVRDENRDGKRETMTCLDWLALVDRLSV
jgi:hypothetical protein